jgi:prepilin-type N-terminal cleavage/methylation domain-containing protein
VFSKNSRAGDAGFSLVELIVAIVVLVIIITPVLSLFVTSANITRKSRETTELTREASNIIESLKASASGVSSAATIDIGYNGWRFVKDDTAPVELTFIDENANFTATAIFSPAASATASTIPANWNVITNDYLLNIPAVATAMPSPKYGPDTETVIIDEVEVTRPKEHTASWRGSGLSVQINVTDHIEFVFPKVYDDGTPADYTYAFTTTIPTDIDAVYILAPSTLDVDFNPLLPAPAKVHIVKQGVDNAPDIPANTQQTSRLYTVTLVLTDAFGKSVTVSSSVTD